MARKLGDAGWLRFAAALTVLLVAGCGGARARPATTAAAPAQVPRTRTAPATSPARPAPQPGAHRAPHEAVPILMYHVIAPPPAGTPFPALWVAPSEFAAEVGAVRRAGYHAVTLQRVWDAWHHGATLPRKPIVFSFDDGYGSQVRTAMPTLARAGWPGVLNLKLGNLADMGGSRAVRRLIAAGWEIDSHTLTHPDLTTIGAARLRDELVGSRAKIKRLFGVPANFFCYPSGRFDATVIAAVRAAGYLAATTVQPGYARPGASYTLARVRIDAGIGADGVLSRLRDLRGSG